MDSPITDLLSHVSTLPAERGGLLPDESLVLGLSGGVDSMVLLDVLARLADARSLRVVAAHLDHGLRPESSTDVEFCRQACDDRGIPFHSRRIDVGALAVETGLGLEGAGRQARYEWFDELRAAAGLDTIVTAHHREDHVETLLLWLFRGTGLSGMRGISPRSDGRLRPLRDVRRADIEAYAAERGIEFRDDPLNRAGHFRRNRIRQEILPLLEDVFDGGVAGRIAGFAQRLESDLDGMAAASRWFLEDCTVERSPGRLQLDREKWLELDKALQIHVLREILPWLQGDRGKQMWNESAYSRVLEFTRGARTRARIPLPGGGWLEVGRSSLWFLAEEAASTDVETPELVLSEEVLPPSGDVVTFPSEGSACFDADHVRLPVKLRFARPGDRIWPLGRQGRRKLTDLCREMDLPQHRRSELLVVEDADRIIWAVGITLAEDARPTEHSQRILKLSLEKVP